MNKAPFSLIDLAEHNDWFKDGEIGRKQFEAVFSDAFRGGANMVPIVHDGKTVAFAMSPECTKEMMVDHVIDRVRGDDRLLLKILKQIETR